MVLDSYSTDNTEAICREKGARFFQAKWEGYAAAKNRVNELSTGRYILSIDADEALSEELRTSILQEIKLGLSGAYSMNRRTNYCGTWIYHGGWYPDLKIRLFPRETAMWAGSFVHEELKIDDSIPVKHLEGDLLHYSYYTKTEHRQKADNYSRLTALKMKEAGRKPFWMQPYISAAGRFLGMYFMKSGWKDGAAGWHIARISALSNIVKYKELARLNKG